MSKILKFQKASRRKKKKNNKNNLNQYNNRKVFRWKRKTLTSSGIFLIHFFYLFTIMTYMTTT